MEKKLIRETRWAKHYKTGENSCFSESKFMTGEVSITLNELKSIWDRQTDKEIFDFTMHFCKTDEMSQSEYDEIVEFAVSKIHPHLGTFPQKVAYLSDKQRALNILSNAIAECPFDEPKANLYQAIGILGMEEALPLLKKELDCLKENPELWKEHDFMNWVAGDFVVCMRSILEIEFDHEMYQELLEFEEHPNDGVRRWAWMAKSKLRNQFS